MRSRWEHTESDSSPQQGYDDRAMVNYDLLLSTLRENQVQFQNSVF